eukprot:gnl/TRDRNA2_/TRDRNA2_190640_c0_seq1.p1 gnl/TRDRNA2_/TRDRNA2_190640_c0~~gnl/TRDRNA2_/TRDRNA2_190640_c0_seq1.p1  ORF type:complete len:202 (+),score=41.35 gnl/TRDRNA2_/TRDRNA2_190640_c0_seq1:106-711(+)
MGCQASCESQDRTQVQWNLSSRSSESSESKVESPTLLTRHRLHAVSDRKACKEPLPTGSAAASRRHHGNAPLGVGCAAAAAQHVDELLATNAIVVFSKAWCPFCTEVKAALSHAGLAFEILELEDRKRRPLVDGLAFYEQALARKSGGRRKQGVMGTTVPAVFIAGHYVGGADDIDAMRRNGELASTCVAVRHINESQHRV